jgi:glycogen(starch) synthase
MKHLILSREYPPAPYPPGGIGTYVRHVCRLLAESGEEVHVIAQRWREAPVAVEELCGGRLVVHRVAADDRTEPRAEASAVAEEREGLLASPFPERWFVACRAAGGATGRNGGHRHLRSAGLGGAALRLPTPPGARAWPPPDTTLRSPLHSPTEFIFLHNGWDLRRKDYLPMKRLEDYTIAAADAHLTPSRFLARQCEERYGLEADSITVLPYPLGDTPVVERPEATWSEGTICYVGRLEPRKGVVGVEFRRRCRWRRIIRRRGSTSSAQTWSTDAAPQ